MQQNSWINLCQAVGDAPSLVDYKTGQIMYTFHNIYIFIFLIIVNKPEPQGIFMFTFLKAGESKE